MGWREGETPLAILFFFFAKSVTFRGVFLIDVILVQNLSQYHPLTTEAPAHLGESRARDERSRHAQSRAYNK